jgi:hypothetical protein
VSRSADAGSRSGRLGLRAIGSLLVLAGTGFAAYHQMFTTHAAYDDEGYVMLALAAYLDGKPLYDEVYAQYGPAPFALWAAVHRVLGLPVGHDVTRIQTILVWLLASSLGAVLVARLTRSWPFAAIAFVLGFLHLERLCLEPGHPQALCALAVAGACLLLCRPVPGAHRRAVGLGVLVASVVMTKTNVGVLLLAAVATTMTVAGPRDRAARLILAALLPLMALAPFVVARAGSDEPGGLLLPAIVAYSSAATLWLALRRPHRVVFRWSHLVAFATSLVATCAVWAVAALADGTSPAGLWYGLVGQHTSLVANFASAAPIPAAALPWAVVGFVGAFLAADRAAVAAAARVAVTLALAWTCLQHLSDSTVPLVHGRVDRGATGALVGFATPLLWVLLKPAGTQDDDSALARLGLCFVACLLPLSAYPTAGTQMAVGSFALLLGCVVVVHDGIEAAAARRPSSRLAAVPLAAVLLATLLVRDVHFRARWTTFTPLDLPGAGRLRMPAETAARYRWIVESLRERADTFVFAARARNSFYFWTRLPPPTALNPTLWQFLLRPAEQQRVIAALESASRPAVVQETTARELEADAPLRVYLVRRFAPSLRNGPFEIWLPTRDDP